MTKGKKEVVGIDVGIDDDDAVAVEKEKQEEEEERKSGSLNEVTPVLEQAEARQIPLREMLSCPSQ